MQHQEVKSTQREAFTALGNMAHFVRDETTNGVEMVLRVRAGQGDRKGVIHPLNRGVSTDPVGAVCKCKDIDLVFSDVEFVLDFTDDLLQNVFNRDQTGHATELVNHDGQVVAVTPKIPQ